LSVNLFVYYVYTQTLPEVSELGALTLRCPDDDGPMSHWKNAYLCVDAYILAEEIGASGFRMAVSNFVVTELGDKNTVWDSEMNILRQPPAVAFLGYIHEDRVILQFLVDRYCRLWRPDAYGGHGDRFPKALFLRCMRIYRELIGSQQAGLGKWCYLEHASDTEKTESLDLHMRFDEEICHGYVE
jgi:hypothetical protein